MAMLIIHHKVGNFETFKEVFLDDQERGFVIRSRQPVTDGLSATVRQEKAGNQRR